MPLTFGALNRDGGERRLNVAVTRARQELVVYSSFRGDQIAIANTKARGVKDLKHFLDYAEKGPSALQATTDGSVGGFDSPFEEAVFTALEARGWQVVTQVGVSGFRVDLGVVHPDRPGAFLAGVECDGATYHRSAAARDRDKTRQAVLESLGWSIVRIWSPDWWYDSRTASDRVHHELTVLLDRSRKERLAKEQANQERLDQQNDDSSDTCDQQEDEPSDIFRIDNAETILSRHDGLEIVAAPTGEPQLAAGISGLPMQYASAAIVQDSRATKAQSSANITGDSPQHRDEAVSLLPDQSPFQSQFFEPSYDKTLRAMAEQIIATESPIRDDVLAKKIARAHGFGRMGANIRSRILSLLDHYPATQESTGRFLWNEAGPQPRVPFRFAANEEDRRTYDEISLAELRGFIDQNRELLTQPDPVLAIARAIGVGRVSQQARERIEEAIAHDK